MIRTCLFEIANMTALGYNVAAIGFEPCAKFVFDTIRKTGGLHLVFLSYEGGIAIIPQCENNRPRNDPADLVGAYRWPDDAACVESITDDLLHHWGLIRPDPEPVKAKPRRSTVGARGRVCKYS